MKPLVKTIQVILVFVIFFLFILNTTKAETEEIFVEGDNITETVTVQDNNIIVSTETLTQTLGKFQFNIIIDRELQTVFSNKRGELVYYVYENGIYVSYFYKF